MNSQNFLIKTALEMSSEARLLYNALLGGAVAGGGLGAFTGAMSSDEGHRTVGAARGLLAGGLAGAAGSFIGDNVLNDWGESGALVGGLGGGYLARKQEEKTASEKRALIGTLLGAYGANSHSDKPDPHELKTILKGALYGLGGEVLGAGVGGVAGQIATGNPYATGALMLAGGALGGHTLGSLAAYKKPEEKAGA